MTYSENHTENFSLGLFQTDLVWENIDANLKHLETRLATQTEHMDLLLLPEMFTTGFSMHPKGLALNENEDSLNRLIALAKKYTLNIAGSVIWKGDHAYRNRFLWVDENGIQGFYDKKHLFGLGGERDAYESGTEKKTWLIKGWRIAPFVCYDLRFPEWCRNDSDYDLALFTANWPASRSHHWKALLPARAIENQYYVAGLNRIGTDGNELKYSGNSIVCDANGTLLSQDSEREELKLYTLSKSSLTQFRQKLPFLKDRNLEAI